MMNSIHHEYMQGDLASIQQVSSFMAALSHATGRRVAAESYLQTILATIAYIGDEALEKKFLQKEVWS